MASQNAARLCNKCRITLPVPRTRQELRYVNCPDCRAVETAKRHQRKARHDDMIWREAIESVTPGHHPYTADLSHRDTVRFQESIQIQVPRQTTTLRSSSRRTSTPSTDPPPSYRNSTSRDSDDGQFLRTLLEEVGLAARWFSVLHARGVTEGSIRTLQRLTEGRRDGILRQISPEMSMVDRVLFADAILHIDSTEEFY